MGADGNDKDKGHSNSRIIIYTTVKDTVGRQTNNKNIGKRTEAKEGRMFYELLQYL